MAMKSEKINKRLIDREAYNPYATVKPGNTDELSALTLVAPRENT